MNLFVPKPLLDSIDSFGEIGPAWLARLPETVQELGRAWGITVGPALDHGGTCSWVAPARMADGTEAMLKVGVPHDEARLEAAALRFLDGHGAVKLLRASDDGYSLLLERCMPGVDLWSLDIEAGDRSATEVLRRMWRDVGPDAPFQTLEALMAWWSEDIPASAEQNRYPVQMVAHAVELGQALAATQTRKVFLHGDFHPSNVLAAQREPWLIIDPKALVGEPAYDLAQWLGNRYEAAALEADPVAVLRGQVARFADWLELDARRIAGWAFVKSLGWDWDVESAATFERVAHSLGA